MFCMRPLNWLWYGMIVWKTREWFLIVPIQGMFCSTTFWNPYFGTNLTLSMKILSIFLSQPQIPGERTLTSWSILGQPIPCLIGLKYLRRSRKITLPKVSSCPPVIFSCDWRFWRHKPSWRPPVALLFVLELFPTEELSNSACMHLKSLDEMMCQPELPLFVFQILLFRGCQVKVTLFKSPAFKRSSRWKALPSKIPDVRSISAVSRSQLAPLASFIQLHGETAEVVVDLGVSRPRGGLKVILT